MSRYLVVFTAAWAVLGWWHWHQAPRPTLAVEPLMPVELVKRWNPTTSPTADFEVRSALTDDAHTLLVANDGLHGFELWRSNGLTLERLADLFPGREDGAITAPHGLPFSFMFFGNDGPHYGRVFVGSESGVTVVAHPTLLAHANLLSSDVVPIGDGRFVFAAMGDGQINQLWASDGTVANTGIIHTFAPADLALPLAALRGVTSALPNHRVVFQRASTASDAKLWVTDLTDDGTALLADVGPIGQFVMGPTFAALVAGDIYTTDGTLAGTTHHTPSTDFSLQVFDSVAHRPLIVGATVLTTITQSSGITLQSSLLRLSPAPSATPMTHAVRKNDFATNGSEVIFAASVSSGPVYAHTATNLASPTQVASSPTDPHDFVRFKSKYYYVGTNGGGHPRLYSTDSLATDPRNTINTYGPLIAFGDYLYYVADDGTHGQELWRTDGAANEMVADINSAGSSTPSQFMARVDGFLFLADDGTHGRELHFFNGTTVSDFGDINTVPARTTPRTDTLVALDDQFLFLADDGIAGAELWRTDGTADGTHLVRDIDNGALDGLGHPASSVLTQLKTGGGYAYFKAYDSDGNTGIWRSNGTNAGTLPVTATGASAPQGITDFAVTDEGVFYAANGASTNGVFFISHQGGATVAAHTIVGTGPEWLTRVGNKVVYGNPQDSRTYAASSAANSKVDLGDLCNSCLDNNGNGWTFQDKAFFFGATGSFSTGFEVYASDGTLANTSIALQLVPGSVGLRSYINAPNQRDLDPTFGRVRVQVIDDHFYLLLPDAVLSVHEGDATPGLWLSDGTTAGTRRLFAQNRELMRTPEGPVVELGDAVLHDGYGAAEGTELWLSTRDGSGSTLVKDIAPGLASSRPRGLIKLANTDYILFSASDPEHGVELWKTKGTSATTTLVLDVNPGPGSSTPHDFFAQGDAIFFMANDGAGEGLYRISATDLRKPPLADAGADQHLSASAVAAAVSASASADPDGEIVSYQWTQIAGPTVVIAANTAAQTLVSGLTPAQTYELTLTVVDNDGLSSTDHVVLTVDASAGPVTPTGPSFPAATKLGATPGCRCGSTGEGLDISALFIVLLHLRARRRIEPAACFPSSSKARTPII